MKKFDYIALASLAAAIAVVSCSKEDSQSSSASEGTVLTANIRQAPDTKTGMSGASETSTDVSIVWTEGDKLSVLSGASYATNNEFTLKSGDAGKSSGSFTGASVTGDIIAVYPYACDVEYATDKVILNIPRTQAYASATFAQNSVPMVAKGTVGTALDFNYLFSAIAFKVNGGGKNVTKVTVTATAPLWGPAEITNLNATPIITMTGTDRKYFTVELTCTPAQDISSDRAFYIAVPAGTYTFAVNVHSGTEVFHQSYATARTFAVGSIKYNSTAKAFNDNGPAYVDGNFIGDGIKINGIYWAPVNCGYDEIDYRCGKLYQWGRMDGSGYHSGLETVPAQDASDMVIQTNLVNLGGDTGPAYTTSAPAATSFYMNPHEDTRDWYTSSKSAQFSAWPMTAPSGTSRIGNPCPSGWRVPTSDELGDMVYSDWDSNTQEGNTLRTYSWDSTNHTGTVNGLTLPAAGYRDNTDGGAKRRSTDAYYWSSTVVGGTGKKGYRARLLMFDKGDATMFTGARASGYPVRCVQE